MKALRPLIYIIAALLVITFIFENSWMFEDRTITYSILFWDIGQSPPFPIWGMVLLSFAIGYALAWGIGRLEIWSAKRQNSKLKKRATAAEAERDNLQGRLREATAPQPAVPATTTAGSKGQTETPSAPQETSASSSTEDAKPTTPPANPEAGETTQVGNDPKANS